MKRYSSAATLILLTGLALVMAGLAMPIITGSWQSDTFRYVYAAGAVLSLAGRLMAPVPDKNSGLRLRRLVRLQVWSAIFYCVATFFVFFDKTSLRDWIAFTLAGAAVQIVSSAMIASAGRKKSN